MCTCISYLSNGHYFGRNLDLEYSYNESIVITPRGYSFHFRNAPTPETNYAMIGIATVANNYPLYYDAVNEYGVCAAGLNFPGNAKYQEITIGSDNIAPFEFIPWVLGQCKNITQAMALLKSTQLANIPFSSEFPNTPLHWMVSDKTGSIVVEPLKTGIRIYANPIGILTNNPPFDFQLTNLQQYLNLTKEEPVNRLCKKIVLEPFSRGMGAIGLPGDLSSVSRFVRAAFTKLNSVDEGSESSAINQAFHILGSVAQTRGCVQIGNAFEKTVYTSCCNATKGVYYYTTYDNSQIHGVRMFNEDLEGDKLIVYPIAWDTQIAYDN